jgi:hypothetical protein
VASSVETVYATGTTDVEQAFCPAGYVALGGGGYDSNGNPHQGESAPTVDPDLTTALSATLATTALHFTAILNAIGSGDTIQVVDGANTQTFVTTAAAAVGATTVNVTSKVAGFAYPVGTDINDNTSGLLQSAPPTSGSGIGAGQSQGWYASNIDGSDETAYVICSH